MSVAYETGTANNANDLLDRLRLFAIAQGWTVNRWAVRSDGLGSGGWCLNLQRGADLHFGLYADHRAGTSDNPGQDLGGFLYPAWDAGLGNMAQANRSALIFGNGLGSVAYTGYHFFAGMPGDAPYLHMVVEVTSGEFKHFGCGRIVRLGAVTSGAYVHVSSWHYGTLPNHRGNPLTVNHGVAWDGSAAWAPSAFSGSTLVRADSDAVSPRYLVSNPGTDALYCGLRPMQVMGAPDILPAHEAGASTITGRAPLWPITAAVRRGGTGLYSPIGQPPHLRWVNLTHLQPKDVITLGTEQWMVFPVIRRQGGAGQPNSGLMGVAYRRA